MANRTTVRVHGAVFSKPSRASHLRSTFGKMVVPCMVCAATDDQQLVTHLFKKVHGSGARRAAKLARFDNKRRTCMSFDSTWRTIYLLNGRFVALPVDAGSLTIANSNRVRRVIRYRPNLEPHSVRLDGDTDRKTKFETGATVKNKVRFKACRQVVADDSGCANCDVPRHAG